MNRHNRDFIARLDIRQLAPGLYEYQVMFASEVIDSAVGFSSISDAIEAAADITGSVRGFEVSYKSLVIGTYPLEVLRATAQLVALRAIETTAAFCDG